MRHSTSSSASTGVATVLLLLAARKAAGYSGAASYYNTETGNAGACGQYLKNTGYTVALNYAQWNSGGPNAAVVQTTHHAEMQFDRLTLR